MAKKPRRTARAPEDSSRQLKEAEDRINAAVEDIRSQAKKEEDADDIKILKDNVPALSEAITQLRTEIANLQKPEPEKQVKGFSVKTLAVTFGVLVAGIGIGIKFQENILDMMHQASATKETACFLKPDDPRCA